MKKLQCFMCGHPEYKITDHPESTEEDVFKPTIECTKCGAEWQYGYNAGPYAEGKFAIDERKFK